MKPQRCNHGPVSDRAVRGCRPCAGSTVVLSAMGFGGRALRNSSGKGAPGQPGDGLRGKGVPGRATALLLRVRRCAPTSLRCSAVWPAAELASRTSFAALRQWRRVSSRCALARAATRPVLLGASQARRGPSRHAFADTTVACIESNAREEPSRRAVPGGGDSWSDEDRRSGVGARSAQRRLTRRSCLSAVSKANAASSATQPLAENRSAVGAKRRLRKHEPPPGTAWRDSQALRKVITSRTEIDRLDLLSQSAFRVATPRVPPASKASRVARCAPEHLR